MRKVMMILMFICAWTNSHAQINLVYNPGFEEYWTCPNGIDRLKFAKYWTPINDTVSFLVDSTGPSWCTAEFCHVCATDMYSRIPDNQRFHHYTHSGGGMVQAQSYLNDGSSAAMYQRDYLQGRLKNQLVAGQQYCVTFYVCLEDGSAYACNGLGAYLDDALIDTTGNCGLPQITHVPQIVETSVVTDTGNWTKIQGIFTAIGNERFITLGNFFDVDHTDSIRMHFPFATFLNNTIVSWYLFDDISVIKIGAIADAGNDTSIYQGDTAWVGNHDGYLPVKWYSNGALIDSNHAGFAVHPDTTTSYVMELDVCGTITYDTMTVTVKPVGIESVSLSYVKVYPNPVKDEVMVSGIASGVSYRLLNTLGVCLKQGELNKSAINVGDLPSGMYVLELNSSSDRRNFKIMKL